MKYIEKKVFIFFVLGLLAKFGRAIMAHFMVFWRDLLVVARKICDKSTKSRGKADRENATYPDNDGHDGRIYGCGIGVRWRGGNGKDCEGEDGRCEIAGGDEAQAETV
ncbi:hypothetical protein U5922_003225 [Aquicoccus sp. G2-2]|uniref:hypothetical protein n=1 Tax=Aquicoccus sp. G2-2 TaxID=3092120 RepID=UPI00366BD982